MGDFGAMGGAPQQSQADATAMLNAGLAGTPYPQPVPAQGPDPTQQGGGYPMGLNPYQQQAGGTFQQYAGGYSPFMGPAAAPMEQYAGGYANPYSTTAGGALTGMATGDPQYPGVGGGIGGVSAQNVQADPNTQQMQMAMQLGQQFMPGGSGFSPAYNAAMQNWNANVKPQVLASEAITGNLGGGGTQEAIANSASAAMLPLLQQQQQIQAGLVPQLGNLGLGVSGQNLQAQEANQQAGLTAGLANQQNTLQAQMANQNAALQASQQQQNAAAQLANLGMGLSGQQLGAANQLGNFGLGLGNQQLGAANQLGSLGGVGFGQQLAGANALGQQGMNQAGLYSGALSGALGAANQPYQTSAQQNQAAYNDYLRQQNLAQTMNFGPANTLLGSIAPGSVSTTQQSGGGMFGS